MAVQEDRLREDLAALEKMPPARLRETWCAVTADPVPKVSPALLQLALAWEMQVRVHGGLSRRTTQTLDQLAAGRTHTSSSPSSQRLPRPFLPRTPPSAPGRDFRDACGDRFGGFDLPAIAIPLVSSMIFSEPDQRSVDPR